MKPITLTKYLRLALVAGAPILIGSPALLAADTAFPQSNDIAANTAATPPPHGDQPPPAPDGAPQLLAAGTPPAPPEGQPRGGFVAEGPEKMSGPRQRPSTKCQAENERKAPGDSHGPRNDSDRRPQGMTEEMAALERFLDMTPEQLAMARNLIVRIEQMSDEEKAELRERIQRVRNMDDGRRQKLMELHRQMPWEERMIIYQYMRSLDRAERKQLFAQTRDYSIEQHIAFKKELLAKAKAAGFDESTLPPPDERNRFQRHQPNQGSRPEQQSQANPDAYMPPPPPPAQSQERPAGPPPSDSGQPGSEMPPNTPIR